MLFVFLNIQQTSQFIIFNMNALKYLRVSKVIKIIKIKFVVIGYFYWQIFLLNNNYKLKKTKIKNNISKGIKYFIDIQIYMFYLVITFLRSLYGQWQFFWRHFYRLGSLFRMVFLCYSCWQLLHIYAKFVFILFCLKIDKSSLCFLHWRPKPVNSNW